MTILESNESIVKEITFSLTKWIKILLYMATQGDEQSRRKMSLYMLFYRADHVRYWSDQRLFFRVPESSTVESGTVMLYPFWRPIRITRYQNGIIHYVLQYNQGSFRLKNYTALQNRSREAPARANVLASGRNCRWSPFPFPRRSKNSRDEIISRQEEAEQVEQHMQGNDMCRCLVLHVNEMPSSLRGPTSWLAHDRFPKQPGGVRRPYTEEYFWSGFISFRESSPDEWTIISCSQYAAGSLAVWLVSCMRPSRAKTLRLFK